MCSLQARLRLYSSSTDFSTKVLSHYLTAPLSIPKYRWNKRQVDKPHLSPCQGITTQKWMIRPSTASPWRPRMHHLIIDFTKQGIHCAEIWKDRSLYRFQACVSRPCCVVSRCCYLSPVLTITRTSHDFFLGAKPLQSVAIIMFLYNITGVESSLILGQTKTRAVS